MNRVYTNARPQQYLSAEVAKNPDVMTVAEAARRLHISCSDGRIYKIVHDSHLWQRVDEQNHRLIRFSELKKYLEENSPWRLEQGTIVKVTPLPAAKPVDPEWTRVLDDIQRYHQQHADAVVSALLDHAKGLVAKKSA